MNDKLFNIKNIHIDSDKNLKKLRIDFKYNGQSSSKVVVKLYEEFFKLGYRAIGGEISLKNDVSYWCGDVFSDGLIFRFNDKIKVSFEDVDTKTVLQEEIINIGNTNLRHRSMGRDMSIKNIWFLGDSNVYHYFSNYNYDSDEFFFNNKVITPIDVPELTVNRFINSNPQRFIDSLPLMSGDIFILNLGEIDCRVSLYRNSKLKDRTLINHINNVIDRYFLVIEELIIKNPSIDFIICLPQPPMRDGWVKEVDINHLLNDSKEKDRLFISQYFSRYLKDRLTELEIKYIYPFYNLEDKEGFMDNVYLLPYDNHTKDNEIVIKELKKIL